MADEQRSAGPGQPGAKVKMVANPLPVDEIYVDGFAGLMTRGGVVKLDLYRVVRADTESRTEHRQVSHRLVLPQAVLPELYNLLRSMARTARQGAGATQGTGGGEVSSIVTPDSDSVL